MSFNNYQFGKLNSIIIDNNNSSIIDNFNNEIISNFDFDNKTISNFDNKTISNFDTNIIGITFSTDTTTSRIDNWAHIYDICDVADEVKITEYQNEIYYAQTYHIEKEAFLSLTATLLTKLTEDDAI
ncbi:24501_t:CDS:2 [Cetraspora pellucida]|uniref:24501_t:CDS:1 n=1 Tax=Cetraspora pellucida TaxID=1433469 RepID=A0A9N9NYC1_9GLOM|nr:24501_t:CDS:2 [Cetraspora pellucida]